MNRDKAVAIFDCVLRRVEECRASESGVGAIRPDASTHGGPPKHGNQRAEYIADFAVAGRRVLFPWPQRLAAFRRYYVDGAKYAQVIEELRIPDGTFRWWCSEIKRTVAPELVRRGLYPPRKYKLRTEDQELVDV